MISGSCSAQTDTVVLSMHLLGLSELYAQQVVSLDVHCRKGNVEDFIAYGFCAKAADALSAEVCSVRESPKKEGICTHIISHPGDP